jgi:hypothetical protein
MINLLMAKKKYCKKKYILIQQKRHLYKTNKDLKFSLAITFFFAIH